MRRVRREEGGGRREEAEGGRGRREGVTWCGLC